MKLRVRDNSIRLRLTRSEVDRIATDGLVKARVPFSAGVSFDYVLESSRACVAAAAHLSNNVLTVSLPEDEAREWAVGDQVSIVAEQPLDDGQVLRILVEKDFACLAPRAGEDESDMFDHPNASAD
jgi:hypothetical protein